MGVAFLQLFVGLVDYPWPVSAATKAKAWGADWSVGEFVVGLVSEIVEFQ
jgi:hypothetical protein